MSVTYYSLIIGSNDRFSGDVKKTDQDLVQLTITEIHKRVHHSNEGRGCDWWNNF